MWTIGGTACSCCVALLSFFGQKNTIPLQLEGEICAMSQVVSSLEAVGRYLETAGSFPGFAQAKESHIAFLTSQFGRHTWSVTEGSEALELLQRQVVWTDAERSALAMAVQNGLAARCAAISRQAMQDYTNVILYLPARIWEQLMNSDLTFQAKANLVGTFATSLGLRNPSESTSQMVTSLLLACPGGRDLELKTLFGTTAVVRIVSLGEERAPIYRCCCTSLRWIASCRQIANEPRADGCQVASACTWARTSGTMSFDIVAGGSSGSHHSHEEYEQAFA